MKMQKTNAVRMLEKAKIPFTVIEYEVDENDLSGVHIARQTAQEEEKVFKTLVTKGDKHGYAVFCIPCAKEVDLKKAAKLTGDKKIEFVHVRELLGLTGYIRGGCSPVGMKKRCPTYFDESALNFSLISVSGGARGIQILVNPQQLIEFVGGKCADVTTEDDI